MSWEDCEEIEEKIECPREANDRCLKVYYESSAFKTFTKFCEKEDRCKKPENLYCQAAQAHGTRCEVYCCDDHLCNAVSAERISSILLTCIVLAVAFSITLRGI